MSLVKALRQGKCIRHRDWPPFHYARLDTHHDRESRLWRIRPLGKPTRLDAPDDELREDRGWFLVQITGDHE